MGILFFLGDVITRYFPPIMYAYMVFRTIAANNDQYNQYKHSGKLIREYDKNATILDAYNIHQIWYKFQLQNLLK